MDIIFTSVYSIIIAIIGFSILIFVHELGHFIMAKIFKIKVEKFSIGMGPAIYGFQKGETYFQIGAVPFGGFCKFKGDEITDKEEDTRSPDSFYGAKPYKRLLVALFGPLMNYIVAIIFLSILAMGTHNETFLPNKILLRDDFDYKFIEKKLASPAKLGGLETGDIIIKINETDINSFQDITMKILSPGLNDFIQALFNNKIKKLKITVIRNGKILENEIQPIWDKISMRYIIGIAPYNELNIKNSDKFLLNQKLGLSNGDRIIGIDDDYTNMTAEKINSFLAYNFGKNKKSTLHIRRQDKILDVQIVFNEINHEFSEKEFGLTFKYELVSIKGENFFKSFITGFNESNKIVKLSIIGLFSLIFKEKEKVQDQIGGPLFTGYLIAEATIQGFSESIYEGLRNFISMISYISLALAFFNLLPIPALDGGHILFNLIEIIIRRPIKLKLQYTINMIFFLLLMTFAVLVLFLDFSKLINIGK